MSSGIVFHLLKLSKTWPAKLFRNFKWIFLIPFSLNLFYWNFNMTSLSKAFLPPLENSFKFSTANFFFYPVSASSIVIYSVLFFQFKKATLRAFIWLWIILAMILSFIIAMFSGVKRRPAFPAKTDWRVKKKCWV